MKILNNTDRSNSTLDITELFIGFKKEHRSVFIYKIEEEIFFLRSLNRKEFKSISEDTNFNDMEKEEIICSSCTLWPEDYDFENCDAGVPTVLSKVILEASYLNNTESRKQVLSNYRMEMFDLDNQINCIINEAFPECNIEEIEEWDIEKTSKYLSRAEWKLANLRGMNINYDPFEDEEQEAPEQSHTTTEEIGDDFEEVKLGTETIQERQERLERQGKQKMTPDKLNEMKAKFPEINWDADTILREGLDGMRDSIDTSSPALRSGR
jgi:hypothetical protein